MKRVTLLAIHFFVLFFFLSFNTAAQDRAALEREIGVLREQLKQKEDEFLSPSAGDRAAFAESLRQPDAGLARLMPREKYRERLTVREGGAYYSFTRLSNSYDDQPQIGLEKGTLKTGFAGTDFGFLCSLGDVPLESFGFESEVFSYLLNFTAPLTERGAREEQRRAGAGFVVAGQNYRAFLPAVVNQTYILRTISYDRFDVLVALRVVRKDTDDSLILAWKKLREFPTPHILREEVVR